MRVVSVWCLLEHLTSLSEGYYFVGSYLEDWFQLATCRGYIDVDSLAGDSCAGMRYERYRKLIRANQRDWFRPLGMKIPWCDEKVALLVACVRLQKRMAYGRNDLMKTDHTSSPFICHSW